MGLGGLNSPKGHKSHEKMASIRLYLGAGTNRTEFLKLLPFLGPGGGVAKLLPTRLLRARPGLPLMLFEALKHYIVKIPKQIF